MTSMCHTVAVSPGVYSRCCTKRRIYLQLSPVGIIVTSLLLSLPASGHRFLEGQTGHLRRGLLPGRHPPDLRGSPALSDTMGGGQAQEKGEGGGPEPGPRHRREDVGAREASGRRTVQNWRVCPLRAPLNGLKETQGLRLRLLHTEIQYMCF